jgi:hypothetical protein
MDLSYTTRRATTVSKAIASSSTAPQKPETAFSAPNSFPPVSESIKKVPSTRYYGSKRLLLPWIYKSVRGLQFESALDIFGGSASVSLLLLLMRKSVTYHDGLHFNEDVARTDPANLAKVLAGSRGASRASSISRQRVSTSRCGSRVSLALKPPGGGRCALGGLPQNASNEERFQHGRR